MVRRMNHAGIEGQPRTGKDGISGEHTASQAFVKDCTVVYGDCRGIVSAMTVLDACAVRGLRCRG